MKRVIIVHGWGGSSKTDFLPWAKEELEKLGYEVITPDMPDTDYPKIETWVPSLTKIIDQPKEDDIFIGHSIGCQTILRYLETLKVDQKVDKVILVAPWVKLFNLEEEDLLIANPWEQTIINWGKIKKSANSFIAIFSDNDPNVPLEENKKIFEDNLGAKTVIEHDKGHFNKMPNERPDLLKFIDQKSLDFSFK